MIDVLKRLAELDAQNPNIIKEGTQVDECGMMPEMGLDMPPPLETKPSQPASINMTAGSGEELGDLLTTIMSLAGVAKGGADAAPSMSAEPVAQTLEPAAGPGSPADSMRSVIDRLNPMDGDDDEQEVGAPDTVTKAMGDFDDDGDHDENDHALEKDDEEDREEVPEGTASGQRTPGQKRAAIVNALVIKYLQDTVSDAASFDDWVDEAINRVVDVIPGVSYDDLRNDPQVLAYLESDPGLEEVDEYNNTPADPNKKPAFDANKFAHKENQPRQGDRMDGDRPKAYADMNEAVNDLFAQYKKFVNEN